MVTEDRQPEREPEDRRPPVEHCAICGGWHIIGHPGQCGKG